MSKPNVLIFGGVGFIGRNFVKYLVDNNLAGNIRVVDKVLLPTAFLGEAHQKAFEASNVEFKQGNLTREDSIEKCFQTESGYKFNYVFNLAAETKLSQTNEVYKEKVLDLSVMVAKASLKHGVDRFVEVSTGQVYEPKKNPSKETDSTKPWTGFANYKLQAEAQLTAMKDLPLNIVRPAIVYGPGDSSGVSPRLICGAVYKHLGEKMKFLWSSDLRMNTVHVNDVAKALWHIATQCPKGEIYNLADKNDSTQGSINEHLEKIFGIKTGFHGGMISKVASLNLKSVTEEVNDKHLKPWSEICKKENILNTPLTPYLDLELLHNNHLAVDGSKIEKTGFKYDYPQVTEKALRDQADYFVKQKLFPSACFA
eukprot:TRINITY_DN1844_c0_g1_i1.p1 TRINITY_DN1844_c0_g1~~TRINITY_DN1844_c0_g1_i1.p1  ORF type:complete len:368 (-),score=88.95 TRINITY_DN1844_c0_g1_i1:50-1153(-)